MSNPISIVVPALCKFYPTFPYWIDPPAGTTIYGVCKRYV